MFPISFEGPVRKIAGQVLMAGITTLDVFRLNAHALNIMVARKHARLAPLVFLGAWAEQYETPNHARWQPSIEVQRSYKARRLDTGIALG